MKLIRNLIAISIAVLAVAAVAYAVICHFDDVMRPVQKLLSKLSKYGADDGHDCDCCCSEEVFEVNSEA